MLLKQLFTHETIINYWVGWFYRKYSPIYNTKTKLALALLINTNGHLNSEYFRKFNYRFNHWTEALEIFYLFIKDELEKVPKGCVVTMHTIDIRLKKQAFQKKTK